MRQMPTRGLLILVLVACVCGASCGSLPRDPKETLRRVEGGRLRVGLVEHPPWVVHTEGEPSGAEVELVREFAREVGATPEWHWGGEQQQMEALEHYQLDLLIGGLTKDTAWSKYVGLTSPYFESRIVVGVPASTPPLKSVKGVPVAVAGGDPTAYYLESKGAVVVPADDLSRANAAAFAAPEWQLEAMGLTPTNVELRAEKHVMAAPPGENGFIKRLDEFLDGRRGDVRGLLVRQQQQEARR
jgi:polar amino acid transport system substrate-binding protein